jgi:hypothetical protein
VVDVEYATGIGPGPSRGIALCQSDHTARPDGTVSCFDKIPASPTGGPLGGHAINFTGRTSGKKATIVFTVEALRPQATTTPTASPMPFASPPTTASPGQVLPAAYVGTWSGTMNQPNYSVNPYPMTMTLHAASVGSELGDASYPTLPCTTRLVLKSVEAQSVTADEHAVSGECLNGTFTLQLSNNTLSETWRTETGEVLATASLTREQP